MARALERAMEARVRGEVPVGAVLVRNGSLVIYSGHNEFVEGAFALELGQEWTSPLMLEVAGGLRRLRVVNVLSGVAKGARTGRTGAGHAPEARTQRQETFAGITYDKTLLYYAAYEQNLRAMCRAAHAAGARVLLCTVVSYLLIRPSIGCCRPDLNLPELIETGKLAVEARRLLPTRMILGLTNGPDGEPPIRLAWEDWRERQTGDATDRVEPRLRPLFGALSGAPLWSPVGNWTERTYVLMQTVEQLHRRELGEAEREQVRTAVELTGRALAIDPANALTVHQLALAQYMLGDDDARAAQLFEAAAMYDYAPNAGNRITNDCVRRVAATTPGLAFLDAQACFEERCPGGLVGYEVMMDNCHLHLAARRVLMRDKVPEIVRIARR
jgi:hypothetical protein